MCYVIAHIFMLFCVMLSTEALKYTLKFLQLLSLFYLAIFSTKLMLQ